MFLLRTLNAADVALLKQIGGLVGGSVGALGIIGVASRAMRSARAASTRCSRPTTWPSGSPAN
ncbi:isoniazid inductible protein [Mycobacterium tuberculosis]|nr:isoniazid inductible protein [Mycobacterium tuberculosis]